MGESAATRSLWYSGIAFALMWALVASLPAYATDVPVVVAEAGVDGRQLLTTPPADGFEPVAAKSTGGREVEQPTYSNLFGGWGVSFTASKYRSYPSFIDVTWKNKQTNEERHTFFLVSDKPVRQATIIQVQQGSTVVVDAPPEANSVFSFVLIPPDATGKDVIESANLIDDKKRIFIATKDYGIDFLEVDTADHKRFIIVVQATPKPVGPVVSTLPTPPVQPGALIQPIFQLPLQPGTVKPLAPTTDPATGNTTTGTVKTITPSPGTTVTTTSRTTVTPAGVEVSRSEVTETDVKAASGTTRRTTSTVEFATGKEITIQTEVSGDADDPTSGTKTTIEVDRQDKTKATRTTLIEKWDPKTHMWVQDGVPKVEQISMATHGTIDLPDIASSGSVVTGTFETQVNEAAAGIIVTVIAPSGDQHTTIVGASGRFLLDGAWVGPGTKLAVTQLDKSNIIATAELHVVSGPLGSSASPPQIAQLPEILPQGATVHITGRDLCNRAAVTAPNVVLRTEQGADVIPVLASSDQEVKFQVPRTTPPGPGSLSVENGAGQVSAPKTVNLVKISITTPPTVRAGQPFDAVIKIEGLTAENRQKPVMATLMVSGNATFAGGQHELRVPVKDGMAKVTLVAQGAGGYVVQVTGLSSETR